VNRSFPVQVINEDSTNLADVKGISGIGSNVAVLKNDGTVWAWGNNSFGQFGDGTKVSKYYAVQAMADDSTILTDVIMVTAGQYNTYALKNDGTVWAWGYGNEGRIGDGTVIAKLYPVQVKSSLLTVFADVIAIEGGYNHTVALKSDGTVWTWGQNNYGQLGDNTTYEKNYAVQVVNSSLANLSDVKAIAVGSSHNVALKNDGTVWAWGLNTSGQLGDSSTTNRSTAVQIKNLTNVIAVAAGSSHTVALKEDGTVWTCGFNNNGQLGDGTVANKSTIVQAINVEGIEAISAGCYHTVALKKGGTVWAWGSNQYGQLGDATNLNKSTAVQAVVEGSANITDVKAVTTGYYHTIALKNDGTVWAWGYNTNGQLGDGTTSSRNYAAQVTLEGYSEFTNVKEVAAGDNHNIVLKNDGTVWAWGNNQYGQLGDGTSTTKKFPVQVKSDSSSYLTGVSAVAGGTSHTIVLREDGTVNVWGYNYYGQIGDGTTANKSYPTQALYLGEGLNLFGAVSVSSIAVTGSGGATTITTNGGTLQMCAEVLPEDAFNKKVTWSIASGTEFATINESGLLVATGNGSVTVRATAQDGSGVYGSTTIEISNQTVMVIYINVTGAETVFDKC
jgi:alpha-tubulin suppressor-like RCC1 family protein